MTTSGDYDFNLTRNQIIRAAGRKIGAFAAGETPGAQVVKDFSEALNAMVKRWEASGIHVWTETEATLFLQPGQVRYTLGSTTTDHVTTDYTTTYLTVTSNPGDTTITVADTAGFTDGYHVGVVIADGSFFWSTQVGAPVGNVITLAAPLTDYAVADNAVYTYQSNITRPLRVPYGRRYNFPSLITTPLVLMSRKDYFDLPNKLNTGTINSFYYDPQGGANTEGLLYIWPAPTEVYNGVEMTWLRPIQDFDAAGDTPDLPQEWISTLIFNLAKEMAFEFGMPLPAYAVLAQEAAAQLEMVQGWDREPEPTYFGVDFTPMGGYGY